MREVAAVGDHLLEPRAALVATAAAVQRFGERERGFVLLVRQAAFDEWRERLDRGVVRAAREPAQAEAEQRFLVAPMRRQRALELRFGGLVAVAFVQRPAEAHTVVEARRFFHFALEPGQLIRLVLGLRHVGRDRMQAEVAQLDREEVDDVAERHWEQQREVPASVDAAPRRVVDHPQPECRNQVKQRHHAGILAQEPRPGDRPQSRRNAGCKLGYRRKR